MAYFDANGSVHVLEGVEGVGSVVAAWAVHSVIYQWLVICSTDAGNYRGFNIYICFSVPVTKGNKTKRKGIRLRLRLSRSGLRLTCLYMMGNALFLSGRRKRGTTLGRWNLTNVWLQLRTKLVCSCPRGQNRLQGSNLQ